jgi:hypothetical protein
VGRTVRRRSGEVAESEMRTERLPRQAAEGAGSEAWLRRTGGVPGRSR